MLLELALGLVVVAGGPPGPTLATDGTGLRLSLGDLEATASSSAPRWPDEVEYLAIPKDGSVYFGGAVDPAAASVELGFNGGQVVRVPTVPHARARYFVGQVASAEEEPETIRTFDAAGTVVGVAMSPDSTRHAEFFRRDVGGTVMRFGLDAQSRLYPLVLEPEHREESLCVVADDELVIACRTDPAWLSLGGREGCGDIPHSLTGFVPDGTQRVDLVLGSGKRISVRPQSAPFGLPVQVLADVLPPGEAIRTATARDAAGHVLTRADAEVAPPARRCHGSRGRWWSESDPPAPRLRRPPDAQLAAALVGGGGPQLLARDDGERLCVGIDRLDRNGGDCSLPRQALHDDGFLTLDRGYAFGAYPARVTEIELVYRSGKRVRAPVLPGMEYTGRFRDVVSFALVPLQRGETVQYATLRDRFGRELSWVYPVGPGAVDPLVERRTLVRWGSVRLLSGAYDRDRRVPCLGLRGEPCLEVDGAREAHVVSRCGSRRTIVFGVTPSRAEIRLAHGAPVRPRLAPLPRGRGKAFLAVLGPDAEVASVRFGGRRGFTVPSRPARDQCGWQWEESD
jgi:hypothetical protein